MTVVYINITLVYINITLVYIYDFSVHVWLCGHVMKRQHSHIVKYAFFQKKKENTQEKCYIKWLGKFAVEKNTCVN